MCIYQKKNYPRGNYPIDRGVIAIGSNCFGGGGVIVQGAIGIGGNCPGRIVWGATGMGDNCPGADCRGGYK